MAANHTRSDQPIHFSLVVANWNGEAFLARCLSSALLSAREAGRPFELIVVDDGSTDSSVAMVQSRFPQVRLVARMENRGFAATVNEGVEAARGRYVILLNNDVVVRPRFCSTLLAHFETGGDDLFGVTAKTVQWDGREPNYLKMDAQWRRGDLRLVWADPPEAQPTLFLQAGACALARERFLELGGLASLYAPGYWEDFDLSWRALARGWRNVYEPASPAFHLGKASLRRRYGDAWLRLLDARNRHLFIWANITDARLLASHCCWLPVRIGREAASGRLDTVRAVGHALRRIRAALRRRRTRPRGLGDHAILASVDTTQSRPSAP